MKVFCVLRSGGDFDATDVARLNVCIKKYLPGHELHCLSDIDVSCVRKSLLYDWHGYWSKMELFRSDIEGDVLYLDLDTVLVNDIGHLAELKYDTVLNDFYYPWRLASGVMFLTEQTRKEVWDRWCHDAEYNTNYSRGDQGFLATLSVITKARRWQNDFPGQVISFKRHMRPAPPFTGPQLSSPPREARVVCFHGVPRPKQIIYEPWIREAWA